MKDALKYLQIVHESDPVDFDVMSRWRGRTTFCTTTSKPFAGRNWPASPIRKSPMKRRALQRLAAGFADAHDGLIFPFYSSRWHDLFLRAGQD
jgi:hypothetical protein